MCFSADVEETLQKKGFKGEKLMFARHIQLSCVSNTENHILLRCLRIKKDIE